MADRYEIRLTLRSDATFGRGDGLVGLVDTEIEQDMKTGLPLLRGRTLKGLLVEACADLLFAVEQARQGVPSVLQEAAAFLFGVPGSTKAANARLRIGRAQLPSALRHAIVHTIARDEIDRTEVLNALTVLRRQTAIDETTGAPEEATLRATRVVLRGTPLRAPLRFVETPSEEALALLAACLQAFHRAGTSRNRGRGRLSARLWRLRNDTSENVTDTYLNRFINLLEGNATQVDAPQALVETEQKTEEATASVLTYRLVLRQPVLATRLAGDPNSAVSYDYLPGSAVRGALIARYLRTRKLDTLDGEGCRLFLSGGVRFFNAYPVAQRTKQRALPTPASLFQKKTDRGLAKEAVEFALVNPDEEAQWKPLRTPLAVVAEDDDVDEASKPVCLWPAEPERQVIVHTLRDRVAGRSTAASGAVYRYEALAPGQIFEGALVADNPADLAPLHPLLTGRLTLGGARSVDYGQVEVVQPIRAQTKDWHEANALTLRPVKEAPHFVVVLTSDVLVRDPETGQHTASEDAFTAALEKRLGVQALGPPVRVFLRTTLIGGFNQTWGMHLPQTRALEAGSVFVYHRPEGLTDADLRRVEREGIGERRAEGFGRLALNRHGFEEELDLQDEEILTEAPLAISLETDPEAKRLARQMVQRMLRARLDLRLISEARKRAKEVYKPSNSQLGRLRTGFRNALQLRPDASSEDRVARCETLFNVLNELPKMARHQLERDVIDGKPLLEWLKARVKEARPGDNQNTLWRILDVSPLPRIGPVEAERDEALIYEYNLRLAHEVLARAAKLNTAREANRKAAAP